MLRILEIAIIVAIVVYGFIKLLEMFTGWKVTKRKATAMEKLTKEAQDVANKKADILRQTQATEEQINNINNKLKD